MQTNSDLFTPISVDMTTPTGLIYTLNDPDDKFLKTNDFYTFEMDSFPVPEIGYTMPPAITSLSPIQEEALLFSHVEPGTSVQKYMLPEIVEKSSPVKQLQRDLDAEVYYPPELVPQPKRVKPNLTKEFRCRKCPMSYNFESNLRLHLASHVSSCSTSMQKCPECGMVFKRVSSFKGHLKTHQTSDHFKCNRCDKEYDMKALFERHMTRAHKPGTDGTVEEILAKVASNARGRSRGVKKAQGKYQCHACEKSFYKPCLLKRHEVCHTGAKPYKCTKCEQSFTQKTSLDRHTLRHMGVKDFKCPKCDCSFAQKNNLILHIKRTHPMDTNTDNMFACDYCPCVFTKLNSVNRHKAMMHPEKENAEYNDGFNDDDDDNVNVARVMEQLKSFQESMNITGMQPPALELSLMKPPSPGPRVRTVKLVDTLNPKKEKTFNVVKEILYKGQRTMACMYCDKPFKRQFDLLRHHRTHTKEKLFQCNVCEKAFSTNAALKVHLNIHVTSQEKPAKAYECTADECGKRFSSIRRLDLHTKTHTGSISYICPLCSKTFTSKAGFSAHKHQQDDKEFDMLRPLLMQPEKIESNPTEEIQKAQKYVKRSHQCCVCGLKVQKLSHLKQHEATHTGAKLFKCGICFRSYTTRSSLNLHSKIHGAEKTHVCEVCNAKFITRSLLKRHMVAHSDERKFACPYCNKQFKTSDNCKNHILTHARTLLATPAESEPPPNFDEEVEPPESTSQPLIAIVQSPQKHLSPKFIQLEMVKNCKKHSHKNLTIETMANTPKKSSKKSLARSMKTISRTEHHCGECGKVFYKGSDLKRHLRTHTKEKPFACSLCPKKFALMSTRLQHEKTHDKLRETFACNVCGKKYTSKKVLVVHLRIHTGERPFKCAYCAKTFRTSGHKISHIKAHHKKRK